MSVVRVEKFEEEFEKEEYEIFALVYEEAMSAIYYLEKYKRPLVRTYATIDCRNQHLDKMEGRLTWLVSADSKDYGYNFKKYGIYKLLVKKVKQRELNEYTLKSVNNTYLVLKVLESDVKKRELNELSNHLQQPIKIQTKLGNFELNRSLGWFSLKSSGYEIVLEEDDELSETCKKAYSTFEKYEDKLEELDIKLRAYAAKNMLEDGNEWLEDADQPTINEEQFMERIFISSIIFDRKGGIQAYYDDGDIFWGHCIIVSINEDGDINDCEIAG